MKNFKIIVNSNPILFIGFMAMVLFAFYHIKGYEIAKYFFLFWMFWTILLLCARLYFNGSLTIKNNKKWKQ